MITSKFSETQIVAILKEVDVRAKVKDICRKYATSDATYYKWKYKYGSTDASELKRVKELEVELSQYKRMHAELARENDAMKDLIKKGL